MSLLATTNNGKTFEKANSGMYHGILADIQDLGPVSYTHLDVYKRQRVTRGNYDGRPYVSEDRPADHPSETALDSFNWDFEIDSPAGHAVLAGEIAITIAEYLRGRRNPEPC